MSKCLQAIRFKGIGINIICSVSLLLLPASCANPAGGGAASGRFTFTVADVGQGLAQFGVAGKRAVAMDVGGNYAAWRGAYAGLGSPRIESIIISHSHKDHCGALESFGVGLDWSGEIVVSPYEDTAALRNFAVAWAGKITFKTCARGDTIRTLDGVDIVCLWPPQGLDIKFNFFDTDDNDGDNDLKNHYSLVLSARHGGARALITSDIDDAAMAEIAARSRYDLRAQILSVPHHGSAGSVNPLFFSYVGPEVAVISCSIDNKYGHPSYEMIDELRHHAGTVTRTYIDGTVTFNGNGYYWSY